MHPVTPRLICICTYANYPRGQMSARILMHDNRFLTAKVSRPVLSAYLLRWFLFKIWRIIFQDAGAIYHWGVGFPRHNPCPEASCIYTQAWDRGESELKLYAKYIGQAITFTYASIKRSGTKFLPPGASQITTVSMCGQVWQQHCKPGVGNYSWMASVAYSKVLQAT